MKKIIIINISNHFQFYIPFELTSHEKDIIPCNYIQLKNEHTVVILKKKQIELEPLQHLSN